MSNEPKKTVLDKLLDYHQAVIALLDQSNESECPVQVEVREYRSDTSLLVALTLLDLSEQKRPIPLIHHFKGIAPSEAWIDTVKRYIEDVQKTPHKPITVKQDALRIRLDATEDYLAKRDIMLNEISEIALLPGYEAGVLRQIQELQAHMPYLSTENAMIIWRQAPGASDVRTHNAWGDAGVSIKAGQEDIYMFRQDQQYKEKKSRFVERVYDISQTTEKTRWQPPSSDALEHVRALAALADVKVAQYKKGFGENKVCEIHPSQDMLLVNLSADNNQIVLTAAAIITDRLIAGKKGVRPEERNLISSLSAQLYAIRHGFGAYERAVDNKVEAQLRARVPDERIVIMETARRMAFDMTTSTELVLGKEALEEKGEEA